LGEFLHISRRKPRQSPMRMRRQALVPATAAGGPSAEAFPGTPMPDPQGTKERALSGSLSLLLHAAVIGAIIGLAALTPEETIEQLIEVVRLPDQPSNDEPAPAPRVIAESSGRLAPAPMALAPQVVNPAVIQRRAPTVSAQQIQVDAVSPVQAPKAVQRRAVAVTQARAYQSPIVASPTQINVQSTAPAISGPVEFQAPVGTTSGPRQVVTTGNTVGAGAAGSLGTGSSVRGGLASDRDVFGGKTGARASVNTAVGSGGGRGAGGTGSGTGGVSYEDCVGRSEVQAYLGGIKNRVLGRWTTVGVSGTHRVTMRFSLDRAGSASRVEVVNAANPQVGDSAVNAMRSASPFAAMPDRVACLANFPLTGTFTLSSVAN
jgi:hypothetical protein